MLDGNGPAIAAGMKALNQFSVKLFLYDTQISTIFAQNIYIITQVNTPIRQ